MSLYQKYRPNKFADVLGQETIVTTLKNSILQNKINHAYIFSGPKGIGKTTIAKIFSKAVNCDKFTDDVCNKCDLCKLINELKTTEIIELDAASNNGVEDIRNIIESVKFLPNTLRYKVYIIDEAHMLSNSAWNALLKTLEEPPHYVIFIFATTESYKIPATITSRCQCFKFNRITDTQLLDLIQKVCDQQEIKITKQAANVLVNLAHGSARDALSSLEQAAMYTNNNITDRSVNELFGLVNNDIKIELINNIINHDVDKVIDTIKTLGVKGIDFSQLSLDIANILLDKIIYAKTNKIELLNYLNIDQINSFTLDNSQLIKLINQCQKCYSEIKNSEDPLFNFEVLCFSLMNSLTEEVKTVELKPIINKEPVVKNIKKVEEKKVDIEPNIPNISSSVEFKEILVHKLEMEVKKTDDNLSIFDEENETSKNEKNIIQDLLLKTIACSSKQSILKAKELFQKIKSSDEVNDFKNILSAKQPALASKNAIIFEFIDPIDAEILNANYLDGNIQRKIIKYFHQPIYLLGATAKQLKDLIKILKDDKKKYQVEPDLSLLRNRLKEVDPLAQYAYELFNK